MQKKLQERMDTLLHELEQTILLHPAQGVTPLSENAASVNLQTIFASPGHILSAKYYLPKAQADIVLTKLKKYKAEPDRMIEEIETMIRTGKTKINGQTCLLNAQTITLLKKAL